MAISPPAPKSILGLLSQGASFATGLPRLVMMISSPLSAIWSIRARHRALNSDALMVRVSPPVAFSMAMLSP